MTSQRQVVISGIGVVSPIGIGKEAFWNALAEGRSGVRRLSLYDDPDLPVPFGADVAEFDGKQYVRPRKSLKVMSRDIQLAFAAADLACVDAGLRECPIDPNRLGVAFGAALIPCDLLELAGAYRGCMVDGQFEYGRWGEAALAEMYPLWMLKYLPNMPACHIGIAQDARGPTNSITLGDVSSLSAMIEAVRVIERGDADAMIVGGAGSRIHPASWIRSEVFDLSRRSDDPAAASRPFDALRDGAVVGEGAGAFVVENHRHAEGRGAEMYAMILGHAGGFEPRRNGQPLQGRAISRAIVEALAQAGLSAGQIGHVNANGASTVTDDRIEAEAIAATLDDVPVTAPKSFFGNLGAGTGAVELAASLMAMQNGLIPHTLNYQYPDPECPVNVVTSRPAPNNQPTALVLNHASCGQAVAVVLGAGQ